MGQYQEDPGQTLLARVEELIDEVSFVPDVARKQVRGFELTKRGLLSE